MMEAIAYLTAVIAELAGEISIFASKSIELVSLTMIGEKDVMIKTRRGQKWSREETILAFDLYCHTPFGKIGQGNPEIIQLAELLGRTPSSVGLKMHNLAHHDPVLKNRNVTAMAHGSKLDEEIFNEFHNNIQNLSYEAQLIKAKMQNNTLLDTVDKDVFETVDIESIPPGDYRERVMKERIGHYYYRLAVVNSYSRRCCITGLNLPTMLVASHIKPWKDCDENTEKTNPSNGLCLNSFHDRAFDRGLITIDKQYRVILSDKIKNAEMDEITKSWFFSYEKQMIQLPDKFIPESVFIEYHNDVIFQK